MPSQLHLPKLSNSANDNVPSVQRRRALAEKYLNLARCLEDLSDHRRLNEREREKLRKYRLWHRKNSLWVQVWYRCGGVCERDGLRPMEQLHHKHYQTFGTERAEDMEGLCADCHRLHHRGRKQPANDNLDHLQEMLGERGFKVG